MPTWTQIQYALAINKFRHFAQAAKSCYVTQPTLSQQLQKLEDEIGIILFDRSKKPILPTPEGELFLKQAAIVSREQGKLLGIARQTKGGGLSGDFRLAVIPTVSSDLLPLFFRMVSKKLPKLELHVEEMKTELILKALSEDFIDGAILATPVEGATELKIHPLYYESFFVYLSSGHPLLEKTMIRKEDLDISQMWLLEEGHCFKDQVLSFCGFSKTAILQSGNIHFRSGSLDVLRRLVRSGIGFTLLPALSVSSLPKNEREAHVRPLKSPTPAREISLVYRRDHWKLKTLAAIEGCVVESLPEEIERKMQKNFTVLRACL